MSWKSFPKAWKTVHVVTETFTQRRSECKFYLLYGKHLFLRIAQFDLLLTVQDFPVLPTSNTQFFIALYEAATRAKTFQRMSKICLKSSKRRKRDQKCGKGLTKNLKMWFCWRMVKKIKGKFHSVSIYFF